MAPAEAVSPSQLLSHFGSNPGFEAIVTALAEKPMGMMREALAEKAGLSLGGRLSEHLRDLESVWIRER